MPKPSLDRRDLERVLADRYGTPTQLAPITEGEESQAFCAVVDGRQVVVRVNRAIEGFEREQLIHQRFGGGPVPIPAILDAWWLNPSHAVGVSEWLPGVTVQDLPVAELPGMVESIVLAVIHAADLGGTTGFGPIGIDGSGLFPTWRAYIDDVLDRCQAGGSPDSHLGDQAHRAIVASINVLPETRALVHADFGANNLLVEARRVSGVIDWSEAIYGDPAFDIATTLFWRSWLPCWEAQARYFETRRPGLLRDREQLRAYQLLIGLRELSTLTGQGETRFGQWLTHRVSEVLAES